MLLVLYVCTAPLTTEKGTKGNAIFSAGKGERQLICTCIIRCQWYKLVALTAVVAKFVVNPAAVHEC